MFIRWLRSADDSFPLGPALLPFGTLLTGSTIGTNNEKSTKVWTGDAENAPVELVTYNPDGTLPTNQVYDDIVTDAEITAPDIIDINSNNHAIKTYSTKPRAKLTVSSFNPIKICKEVYKLNKYTDLFICSSVEPYNVGAFELNEDEWHTLEYSKMTGLCADISCDISGYRPNTILVIGHNGNRNGYCFIDTESKKISEYKTIELTTSGTAYVTKENGYRLYYYDGRIYLLTAGVNIREFTITGQTLEELSITLANTIPFLDTTDTNITALQMIECGYPNKVLVLYREYYHVITLSPDNLVISERKNLGSENAWRNDRLRNITPPKWLSGYKEYFFITTDGKTYNGTSGDTGLQWTRFKFNGTEITDIVSQSSNAYFTDKYLVIQDYIQISPSEIIAIYHPYVNNSTYLRAVYINTTTNSYSTNSSLPDTLTVSFDEGLHRMSVVSGPNVYLCGMIKGNFSINSLYPYFDYDRNITGGAEYAINSSTKALAVTSGNIGDTVRIAYEGTYHVPGVPTESIYNTDTSYAIAKKSGVLTVSEPKQTANVEFQTYVGTGKYGSSNKNQLTFTNTPKLVAIVIGNAAAANIATFEPSQTEYSISIYTNGYARGIVNWTNDTKTVEWYCNDGPNGATEYEMANGQMNSSGVTYIAYAVY